MQEGLVWALDSNHLQIPILIFLANIANIQLNYWFSTMSQCSIFSNLKQNTLVIQVFEILLDFSSLLSAAGIDELLSSSSQGGNPRVWE